MFKHTMLLLTLSALCFSAQVSAQEFRANNTLTFGDVVQDRITDERFEVFYTVRGEAGATVVLEMIAIEDSSDLSSPELVLYDEEQNLLFDTFSHFGFREAIIAFEMPYTGNYRLIATRRDGRAGDDIGDYRLRVISPQTLFPGETINDAAVNNKVLNYYVVQQDDVFSVAYEFSNGEMEPEIEAYRVEAGEMISVGTLRGRELRSGAIGLDGSTGDFFIFTVGDSPFATYFDDRVERVDYRIRLDVLE